MPGTPHPVSAPAGRPPANGEDYDDGDDGEEKEGLHDFAECETKTSAPSLGKRDVTEGRWDIHGTQI